MLKTTVTFWGVRGSTPRADGHGTIYGGNTSCVEIVSGRSRLILDAGTGMRPLGEVIVGQGTALNATLLLSHYHRDHLDGLPFFLPLYRKTTKLDIIAPQQGARSPRSILEEAISPPFFPVPLEEVPARISVRKVPNGSFKAGVFLITPFELSHPGGAFGWKIIAPGNKTIIYMSDNEPDKNALALMRTIRDADLVIHDAQYTPDDYKRRIGWGHSPYVYPLYLAMQGGVKRLILTHFDPTYDDRKLDKLGRDAKGILKKCGHKIRCDLASEGMRVTI